MKALIALFTGLVIIISAPSFAELSPKEAVKKVEEHLNGIGTMKANFMQVSADGGISSGQFFLARPGKLRWQYDPPVPLLIIADGKVLQYYDLELDTVSYADVDSTLAGVLARPEIDLSSKDIEVKELKDDAGVLRLTLMKKKKPDEGSLTLVLNDNPMSLRKIEVVDSAKNKSVISFSDVKLDVDLDNKLFEFDKKPESVKK